jgi:hypothetical protein
MKLVQHWRLWWRRWSTWLAAINAIFVGHVFTQPILVVGLIGVAPGKWTIPLAVVTALLAFGLPVLVAHLSQPKLKAKCDAERYSRIQTDG